MATPSSQVTPRTEEEHAGAKASAEYILASHSGSRPGRNLAACYLDKCATEARLREALGNLIKSAKLCPSCPIENEVYVFSMVALREAGDALADGGKLS
jgi:hypothetical protein